MAASLAGCETGLRNAPPISAGMLSAAAQRNVAPGRLERGRDIYIHRCTDCHSLQPMGNYRSAKMRSIVDEMTARAKMGEGDKQLLLDYLRISREAN